MVESHLQLNFHTRKTTTGFLRLFPQRYNYSVWHNIALAAGDSAATVAAKVKEALEADGSSL